MLCLPVGIESLDSMLYLKGCLQGFVLGLLCGVANSIPGYKPFVMVERKLMQEP